MDIVLLQFYLWSTPSPLSPGVGRESLEGEGGITAKQLQISHSIYLYK